MHPASDNLLYPIILNAPIGICILDANTLKIETVNEKFSQFFGKSPDSLHNKNYWSVLKEIKSYHEDALNNVIKTGEPYHENEVELILTRHGKCDQLFITFAYSPIKDNSGNITKIAVWATERTAEVLARKELTDLNESLQTSNQRSVVNQLDVSNMIQQAPVGICVVSGSPLYADEINDVFLEITGKTRDAFLRAPYWEVNAEARGVYEPIMDEVLRTGVTYRGKEHEVKLIRFGNEETVFVDFVFQPVIDAGGKISAAMIVATEVTDKVLAREALQNINNEMLVSNKEISASNEELSVANDELATTQQQLLESLASVAESEERFRTMAESSGIFIAVSNHTGDATYFNNTWTELTGRKMDDLLKYGWTDLVHPEDINVYMNTYLDALKYKIPFTGEFRIHDKDNSYRWLLSTGSPRFRRDGAFAGYINSSIDISYSKQQEEERKQLLESVKAGERKLEQVIDQMPAHVVLLSGPDMIIESVNQQVYSFWKRTKEIIGKPLLEVLPELKGQPFPQQLDEVYATGKAIHRKESPVDFENEDGTIRKAFVDYSYQALFDETDKPSGVLVMSFEVTDKVISRNLLEKYATDLQNANEELATTNEELIATNEELTATNEELAEIQANLQKSNTEITASEANFRAMLLQAPVAMGLFKGIDMQIELINNSFLKLWNRDSSIIGKTILEALPEIRNQAYYGIMQNVFRTGETYCGIESEVYLYRNGHLDKGYYNFINHPFFGEDGTITGIIVVVTEVTEQVNDRRQL